MHLIAIREVMWRMLFVSLYFSWNPCEDAAFPCVLELACCDASKINICSLSSMAWNIMGCCSRFCLVSPAVHDLFQVIDARTMSQLALTEQATCEFLGWRAYLFGQKLGTLCAFLGFTAWCGSFFAWPVVIQMSLGMYVLETNSLLWKWMIGILLCYWGGLFSGVNC